jgi:hypothetical protein
MSPPVTVIGREAVTSPHHKATIYMAEPHNFVVGNSITVKNVGTASGSSSTNFDGTYAITDVSQDSSLGKYSVSYLTTVLAPMSYQTVPLSTTDPTPVAASTPINFEDARMSRIKVRPTRINLLLNPNVRDPLSGNFDAGKWNYSGCTFSSSTLTSISGSAAKLWARYVSTRKVPVLKNTYYAWSGYFQDYSNSGSTATASIDWYDSSDTLISTSTGTSVNLPSTPATTVRPYVIAKSPATAAYAVPTMTTGILGASKSMNVSNFLFEPANTLGVYFDGTTDTNGNSSYNRDTIWEGDIQKGRSHLYQDWYRRKALLDKAVTDGMYYA